MAENKWKLCENGIERAGGAPFCDNVEMSGSAVSCVVYYGTDDDGKLKLSARLFFPTLRTVPNNTHATLRCDVGEGDAITFSDGNGALPEYPERFSFDGILTVESKTDKGVKITRKLFPSTENKAFYCLTATENTGNDKVTLSAKLYSSLSYSRGTKGVYEFRTESAGKEKITLAPGERSEYSTVYSCGVITEKPILPTAKDALSDRAKFVEDVFDSSLVLNTPDEYINREFAFSKLRITESIFDTLSGPMHCPGGQAYYAAVWANDEAEYAAPYFGIAGNKRGYAASVNLMRLYRPFMHPEYEKPIPASIIAEGLDIWEEAGDEGDSSMYLYGMSRFLLSVGDRELAQEYFDTLDWCIGYIKTRLSDDGVVTSDCDELEARFKIGNANLLTNCLSYGGLVSASHLAKSLGYTDKETEYSAFAEKLAAAIESHFGCNFKGYETYAYYTGCEIFRSYICAPLTVGIYSRAEGTAKALLERLYTGDGFLTAEGMEGYWDRSTLYAFRGIFASGFADMIYEKFGAFTERRLTGDHVPYPIESSTEGAKRHLSAEGGLYARCVIEGMLGITPVGLSTFTVCPSLPSEWDGKSVRLEKIKAFGNEFSVEVMKKSDTYKITVVTSDGSRSEKITRAGDFAEFSV